ncbi:hypothetical protein F503_00533 [Ophiostoma piceae UAMH 11346]|uniref:Uncharacterized protein n=1 Tax=Ophiostoma piceae (strain UAMH 11346) TaxID=1262450 RepID=S3C7B5_OPHP1|nr:hypothetical protein F503_00533 [Ophiostoma piceae UAMH 11346]
MASHHPASSVSSPSSASSSPSYYTASDSDLSSSSSSGSYGYASDAYHHQLPVASVEVLRCMRCARTVETTSTDDMASSGMVRVGHNIYYCDRCARLVGYK